MSRYREVGAAEVWECQPCGVVVADRQRHDEVAHGDWTPRNEKLPNRQYRDPPDVRPGEYNPAPHQRESDEL